MSAENNMQCMQSLPVFPNPEIDPTLGIVDNPFAARDFNVYTCLDKYNNEGINQGFLCNFCCDNYNFGPERGHRIRCRQCGRVTYSDAEARVFVADRFKLSD